MDGLSIQSLLRIITVLVIDLLLIQKCRGQSQLIGPPQPIVARVGENIILPCHLEPAVDVAANTLEWTRSDLNPRFVFVQRAGQDVVNIKNPSYKGRTSLFTDELKHGNISLKLSNVKPADEGRYRCYIPDKNEESLVELVVGSVSSPFISLEAFDREKGGVVLQCESKGWYPEPEVLWLDSEGNLFSAGPTETVRGPDDLYTVSSRVTVEKRHSNRFTCRVQQRNINQTRETQIHLTDDFFNLQSSSSTFTVGFAVSVVCIIILILSLVFFVWKWRQNKTETMKSNRGETDKKQRKNNTKKTKDQFFAEEEREREQLTTVETVQMEDLKGKVKKKTKHFRDQRSMQQQEQQRREEAEKRVKTLKEELETKKEEVGNKQVELQQLQEEKQRIESNLQTLKNKLENKKQELETIKVQLARYHMWSWSSGKEAHQKKMEAEKEVETLKKQLDTMETESQTKIKEFEDKQPEVQQLQDDIQMIESNLQMLIETNKIELERSQAAPVQSSSSLFKWQLISKQRFQEEKQRREEAENKVQTLEEELKNKTEELRNKQHSADKKWTETSEDLKLTQNELQMKTEDLIQTKRHVDQLKAEVKELKDEKQRSEDERQKLEAKMKEMEVGTSPVSPVTVDEVEQSGKYVRLRNQTDKNQHLEGWEIHIRVNNKKPFIYKFKDSFRLHAEKTVTIWASGCCVSYNPPTDLWGWNHKFWGTSDQLLVNLYSHTRELQAREVLEPENTQTTSQRQSQLTSQAKRPIITIDPNGNYVTLKNMVNKTQRLKDWEIHIEVNNRRPFMTTFPEYFTLKAGMTVAICGSDSDNKPHNALVAWRQKFWGIRDEVVVTVFNDSGEEVAVSTVNCEEES